MKGSMKRLHSLCVDVQDKYNEKCAKNKLLKKRVALLEKIIEDYQNGSLQPKISYKSRLKPLRTKPDNVSTVHIKTEPGLIHDDSEVEYLNPLPKEPSEIIDLSCTQKSEEKGDIKEEKNDFEERSRFHPFNVITIEEAEQEKIDADKRRAENLKSTEDSEVEETENEVEETEEEEEEEEVEVEEEEEEEEVEVEETEEEEEVEVEEDDDDGEEEQEEVSMVHINGKHYYATNEKNGEIYEMLDDEDIGDEVGKYVNGTPVFH